MEARHEALCIPSLMDVEAEKKRPGLQDGRNKAGKKIGKGTTSLNRAARRAAEQPRKNKDYWGSLAQQHSNPWQRDEGWWSNPWQRGWWEHSWERGHSWEMMAGGSTFSIRFGERGKRSRCAWL